MKFRYLVAMFIALSFSIPAFAADDAETMFANNDCKYCHAPYGKYSGPSISEIAKKYKGNNEAPALLEKKVREGGSGVWGVLNMPATPATVSDENIKAMVEWMLVPHGEELFKRNKCDACHDINKKLVGPSLKAIASKYASDKEAQGKLSLKVRTGGSGSFGSAVMPASEKSISNASIYSIVEWILTLPTTAEPKVEAKDAIKTKSNKKAK